MNYELRPYQVNAAKDVWNAFDNGEKTALVVLPTGCGKTTVMAAIAEEQVRRGKRVLLLAHRNSLLLQGQNSIENATSIHVGFEGGKSHPCKDDRIIVSSVQTLSREDRLTKFNPKAFGLIMVDEAHHIPAKTYKTIMEYFGEAKVLGVTATPKRGDNTDVSTLFGTVVSEYTLASAIKDGWLSPIKVQQCPITIDVSGVNLQSGDYAACEIGAALLPYLDAVADAIIEKAQGRKTIIFAPLVSTAVGMVELLRKKGARADYVAGERKDSPEIMEAYHNGEIDILVNSLLLTEGYDEPSISCVVNLRLTKSEALLTQIIGRGTRLFPGKEDLLVLDFLWKDKEKRKRLNTQALIAAGDDSIPTEELASVLSACADDTNGEAVDVFEAVEEAKVRAKEQREAALAKALADAQFKEERARKLAEERNYYTETAKKAKEWGKNAGYYALLRPNVEVVYSANEYTEGFVDVVSINDPTLKALGLADYLTSDADWEQCEPSEAQLKMLSTLGVPTEFVVNSGQASFLLNDLFERRKNGLCSYKQAKMLLRYKVSDVAIVEEPLAKAAMNVLSKNKWRPNDAFWALFKE